MHDFIFGLMVLATGIVLFFAAMKILQRIFSKVQKSKFFVYVGIPCGVLGVKATIDLMDGSWLAYGVNVSESTIFTIAGIGLGMCLVSLFTLKKKK